MTTTTRPIAVKLETETLASLQRLGESRQRSTHWMMREAISQYVEREEARDAYRQDGMRAWADYQATGLHVSADEADAWLAKLEAGEDAEPPACHG